MENMFLLSVYLSSTASKTSARYLLIIWSVQHARGSLPNAELKVYISTYKDLGWTVNKHEPRQCFQLVLLHQCYLCKWVNYTSAVSKALAQVDHNAMYNGILFLSKISISIYFRGSRNSLDNLNPNRQMMRVTQASALAHLA